MRPVNLGSPLPGQEQKWIIQALREIERASQEDATQVADAFSLQNVTDRRSVDPTTITLSQLAQAFATFVRDLKKRGTKRHA